MPRCAKRVKPRLTYFLATDTYVGGEPGDLEWSLDRDDSVHNYLNEICGVCGAASGEHRADDNLCPIMKNGRFHAWPDRVDNSD